MIYKKKYFLLIIFFTIIIQYLIYTNNKQRTSFRYFKWNVQEVSLGKLISISFFSGLFISTVLNNTITNYKNLKNEENHETLDQEDVDIEPNIEMPPQRDIRETQPTISVNYRVVKNSQKNNMKKEQDYSNNPDKIEDWDNYDNEW